MKHSVRLAKACALAALVIALTSCEKHALRGLQHGNQRKLYIGVAKTDKGCDVDYYIINLRKSSDDRIEWYSNDLDTTTTYQVRFDQREGSPFDHDKFTVTYSGTADPKPGKVIGNPGYYRYSIYAGGKNDGPCKPAGEMYTITDPGVHVTQ
jgi:hypothetical protein